MLRSIFGRFWQIIACDSGTYTDGIDYVGFGGPDDEPRGRSLVLTPAHWAETLSFAKATGMRVTLNLNAMHGRTGQHFPGYGVCGTANASEPFPPWNATQSEALLRWTVPPPDSIGQ